MFPIFHTFFRGGGEFEGFRMETNYGFRKLSWGPGAFKPGPGFLVQKGLFSRLLRDDQGR